MVFPDKATNRGFSRKQTVFPNEGQRESLTIYSGDLKTEK